MPAIKPMHTWGEESGSVTVRGKAKVIQQENRQDPSMQAKK
jgi:hypothetical protein